MLHNLGALVWVAILLIGAISSISKSARKAREGAASDTQAARVSPPPARIPMPVAAPVRVTPVVPRSPAAPAVPVAPASPIPIVRAETPLSVPEVPVPPVLGQTRRRTGVFGGLFEDRRNLMRAVIAAEVLGPPAALREQTFWSPRHSEPST